MTQPTASGNHRFSIAGQAPRFPTLAEMEARDSALEADPHAGCIQPHRGADGDYHDCDGRPI